MSRKTSSILWLCLLLLLPVSVVAQTLEYWFDDDFDNRSSVSIATETEQELSLNLQNLERFPFGFHKLYMRAVVDGIPSAITFSYVYKIGAGKISLLEYWIDDDYDNVKTIGGKEANTGGSWQFLDSLDMSTVAPGFHKLNCRAVSNSRLTTTAVTSTGFYKNALGKITHLEYWLDNDRKNIQTVAVNSSEDGSTSGYTKDFNLTTASPGHHKVHFRAVSADRKTTSAVTTTAVVVKSRYNVDNPDDLKVVHQAYWVDDGEQDIRSVSKPGHDIDQPYVFDARKLSEGQHTFYMQFQNSAGIWNAPVASTFTKTHEVIPVIVANSEVKDGIVTVNFSTMPFGEKYWLVRKYPSGRIRKVDDLKGADYPAMLRTSDKPAPGNYTYYVEGLYTDADGKPQHVQSNEMSVTVEKGEGEQRYWSFKGVLLTPHHTPEQWQAGLYDPYKRPYNGQYHSNYKIYINGERFYDAEEGLFYIPHVPYGAELNFRIEDDYYFFPDVSVIVNENTSFPYFFYAQRYEEVGFDVQPDNLAHDLKMTSDIHLVPGAWELTVENNSRIPWSGNIIVKVIRKKDLDGTFWGNLWDDLTSSNSGFDDVVAYTTVSNEHIQLIGHESKSLSLDISNLPNKNKAEDYYVYVYSIRDNETEEKELDGQRLPVLLNFNPSNYSVGETKDLMAYLKTFSAVMKYLEKVKDWGDPFTLCMKKIPEETFDLFDDLINEYEHGQLDLRDDEVDAYIDNLIDLSFNSSGFLLTCLFRDLEHKIKWLGDSEVMKVAENIDKLYKTMVSIQEIDKVDDDLKPLYTLKALIQAIDKVPGIGKDPFISVYLTYFDVAEAMIKKINEWKFYVQGGNIWERMWGKNCIYKIKVRKYTGDKKNIEYFSADEFNKQIQSIQIKLKPEGKSNFERDSQSLKIEPIGDELVISNVKYNGAQNELWSVLEAWMTITWKNGRVMRVPLLNEYFVKTENLIEGNDPPVFHIELQSQTYQNLKNIANNIYYVSQK